MTAVTPRTPDRAPRRRPARSPPPPWRATRSNASENAFHGDLGSTGSPRRGRRLHHARSSRHAFRANCDDFAWRRKRRADRVEIDVALLRLREYPVALLLFLDGCLIISDSTLTFSRRSRCPRSLRGSRRSEPWRRARPGPRRRGRRRPRPDGGIENFPRSSHHELQADLFRDLLLGGLGAGLLEALKRPSRCGDRS